MRHTKPDMVGWTQKGGKCLAKCSVTSPSQMTYPCDSLKVKYQTGPMLFQNRRVRFLNSWIFRQLEDMQSSEYSADQLPKERIEEKGVKKVRASRITTLTTLTHTHRQNTHAHVGQVRGMQRPSGRAGIKMQM